MSSNLLKAGFTSIAPAERIVIDSNDLVQRRIEELASKMKRPENVGFLEDENADSGDGFVAGLTAARVESLLVDSDELPPAEDLSVTREEADRILEEARAQAGKERDAMMEEASAQLAKDRESTLAQAREEGYLEGQKEARDELARAKQALEEEKAEMAREYEAILSNMENRLVDSLTGIYEQLFSVELSSYKSLLLDLLSNSIRKIDGGKSYLVHVSPEDYAYVSMEKKRLLQALSSPSATLELVEDITLSHNQCMIETDTGIYDCGLDTQLAELGRKIRLLSYEKTGDGTVVSST